MKLWRCWLIIINLIFLCSCSTLTGRGKDNTLPPQQLTHYIAQINFTEQWSGNVSQAISEAYVTLPPVIVGNVIYLADPQGSIIAVNALTGKKLWQQKMVSMPSTGLTVSNGIILVGGKNGVLYALNQNNGVIRWQVTLSDPIVAPATVQQGIVIVKTLDGQLWALDLASGKVQWHYVHGAPLMVLAGGSQPVIVGHRVISGFADGKLAAYRLVSGRLLWENQIANPKGASTVEEMVDIVANPLLSLNHTYIVTYQGNLAAVSVTNGQIQWQLPLSSYTGMAINAMMLFVTDASGGVWAVNRASGRVLWHNTYLSHRLLTAPILIDNFLIIADGEGYVHGLNIANGQTIARIRVSNHAIYTAPMIAGSNSFLVLDNNGKLVRYEISALSLNVKH